MGEYLALWFIGKVTSNTSCEFQGDRITEIRGRIHHGKRRTRNTEKQ